MVIRAATASQPCLHHAITADSEVNMRPGPGLVVMALAFVSVARRGGTSQSNVLKFGLNSDSINDNEAGYLAEINPWLSACDVANPVKAPDLQVNKHCRYILNRNLIHISDNEKHRYYVPQIPIMLLCCWYVVEMLVIAHSHSQIYQSYNILLDARMCSGSDYEIFILKRLRNIEGAIYAIYYCISGIFIKMDSLETAT